jgi:GntR family transcriptional regulator
MSVIDKISVVPYYIQLADLLRQELDRQITNGRGYALPSENDLCRQHGLSRTTVRHALDVLEREGRIFRKKGEGSFAVIKRVEQDLTHLVSTTEDMKQRGWILETRVLSLERMLAPMLLRRKLELDGDDEVYQLVRLRIGDGEPLSLQTTYLPAHLCPNLEANDLSASLYRLLESRYGWRLWTAREVLRAHAATVVEAELLDMPEGAPVMVAERVTYAASGEAVEYLEAIWRGDRYDFTVTLSRP